MNRVAVVFGTRPEAIKLAPVIHALETSRLGKPTVINTGQHAQVLDETIASFDIRPDHNLDIMRSGQSLADLTARGLRALSALLEEARPSLVVGQGDTTTVMATALASFYHGIPFAHVEAGLRTGVPDLPFPEELNRKLTAAIATLHFAPTAAARDNLLREGIDPQAIEVTGNTVIDALFWMLESRPEPDPAIAEYVRDPRKLIVVTAHRRESWGVPLDEIARALAQIAREDEEVLIVFPVHPNPAVRETVIPLLESLPNVRLIEPVPYRSFVQLMKASYMLVTDSGGIQEEAAALQRPVLVMRDVTERNEGIAAGNADLVGRGAPQIVAGIRRLLDDPDEYRARSTRPNPYGDGMAADRIVRRIETLLS